jgi:hypothetical protein
MAAILIPTGFSCCGSVSKICRGSIISEVALPRRTAGLGCGGWYVLRIPAFPFDVEVGLGP